MPEGPLVSVLMPCFNAERWVGQAIDSVLEQTWRHLELIVVDDGSTDRSAAVVAERAAADPRIRLVRQANAGGCAARNRAWSEARGTLLHFLDADDLISVDKTERQIEALAGALPGTLASCAWRPFRIVPGDLPRVDADIFADLSPRAYFARHLARGGDVPIGGWLVAREVAERAGLWDERLTCDQDGEWLARAVAASEGVVFVRGPLLHYRRIANSTSRLKTPRDVWSRMIATDTKARLAETFGIDLSAETSIADDYNDLLVAGWPLSRRYQDELGERIQRYGGPRRDVVLGGRLAGLLARTLGWKLTRRLQRVRWRLAPTLRRRTT